MFGANCKEDHEVIARFTEKLASDIETIEKKTYTVMGKEVTFSFDFLPGNMKFLAFVNSELTNSAKYFSTFAKVSQDDGMSLTGKFGETPDCKWRPWQNSQRLAFSQQVADFKRKIPNHLAVKTKRSKVTQFLAGKKSRQEFNHLLGNFVTKRLLNHFT